MSQTELPSSVLVNPSQVGSSKGEETTTVGEHRITETTAQRRKTSPSSRRVFHIRSRKNGEQPSKTMAITPGEHYDCIETRRDNTYVTQVIRVNNSHLFVGFKNDGVQGGEASRKFGFGGQQLPEQTQSKQLPLGLYEEIGDTPETYEGNEAHWLPEIPTELSQREVFFVKETVERAKDINSKIPPSDIVKLSEAFQTHKSSLTPLQAEFPVFL